MSDEKTQGNATLTQQNGGTPAVIDRNTRGVAGMIFQGFDQLALAGKTMTPKDFMATAVRGVNAYCNLVRTSLAVDRHQKATGDEKAGQVIEHEPPTAT